MEELAPIKEGETLEEGERERESSGHRLNVPSEWWTGDVMTMLQEKLLTGGSFNISNAFTINGQPGDQHNCSSEGNYTSIFLLYLQEREREREGERKREREGGREKERERANSML
ncbi:hypothetical protein EJ110_NYTH14356 [Nymphaea thermarum]|nr:hypothetical protein EJ110_NYTH14356 [Nymphaea thermarum]